MVKRLLFSFALRQPFSAPAERGTRTAAGGFAPNGRRGFSLNLSGECADAARAHKRVDTCGFHPLVNHPFPLESLAQIADM